MVEPLVRVLRSRLDAAVCHAFVRGVYAGRSEWNADFGGEQFSLGRAFYTHLEEGRSEAYFRDAAGSDARVERFAPGLQRVMRELVAEVVPTRDAVVRARRGWAGPGVHIFPAGGHVAEHGGVVHFDTEGLAASHLERRRAAITIVAMLQKPAAGGGLRLWDVSYDGEDGEHEASEEHLARESTTIVSEVGDVVVLDSYRLHQIRPFEGALDRVSATVHAAEIDRGVWETWF